LPVCCYRELPPRGTDSARQPSSPLGLVAQHCRLGFGITNSGSYAASLGYLSFSGRSRTDGTVSSVCKVHSSARRFSAVFTAGRHRLLHKTAVLESMFPGAISYLNAASPAKNMDHYLPELPCNATYIRNTLTLHPTTAKGTHNALAFLTLVPGLESSGSSSGAASNLSLPPLPVGHQHPHHRPTSWRAGARRWLEQLIGAFPTARRHPV
jgi:hypothetical protein